MFLRPGNGWPLAGMWRCIEFLESLEFAEETPEPIAWETAGRLLRVSAAEAGKG